jgi:hypothetical protein
MSSPNPAETIRLVIIIMMVSLSVDLQVMSGEYRSAVMGYQTMN